MSEIKHMFELESKFDFKNKSKKNQKKTVRKLLLFERVLFSTHSDK